MITSPLIQAILDGKIDVVRNLIKNNPGLLEIGSEIGSLPYQIACNKGLVNQQVALIRANALGSENFKDYSELLIDYLSEISEDYACAGWLIDIEFIIWKVVFTKQLLSDDVFRFNEIDEETKEDLRFLSQKANGWACWTDDESEAVFVPLEEWEKMWEEYQK